MDYKPIETKVLVCSECGNKLRVEKGYSDEGSPNWEHRSSKMRCGTCMWFVYKPPGVPEQIKVRNIPTEKSGLVTVLDANPEPVKNWTVGRCRRHAPTLGGWPVVFSTDWCGDHKIDENRI